MTKLTMAKSEYSRNAPPIKHSMEQGRVTWRMRSTLSSSCDKACSADFSLSDTVLCYMHTQHSREWSLISHLTCTGSFQCQVSRHRQSNALNTDNQTHRKIRTYMQKETITLTLV